MATVNIEVMRKDKEQRDAASKRGADWYNIPSGETLMYICPPCRDEDSLPYCQLIVHYGIGPKNRMLPSLDLGINKILTDPRVLAIMEARDGFKVPDKDTKCPISTEWERLDAAGDETARDDIKRNNRFLFNIIPWAHRKGKTDDWEQLPKDKAMPMMTGKTVWDGVLEVFFDEGDITDPRKAILVKVTKTGTGMSTRYSVSADSASIREAVRLNKSQKAACRAALTEGGSGDFYKMIGEMVVDAPGVERMLAGVEEEAAAEETDESPSCFGQDYEAEDDEDCGKCPWRGLCSAKLEMELAPGHALKPGDKGYDKGKGGKGPAKLTKAERAAARAAAEVPVKSAREAMMDDDDDDGGLDALERELENAS
jgi:hypothetical protein